MPEDPNRPEEPQRDINGNPIPPPGQSPFGAPPPRPLPGNAPPPPSFGAPAPGGQTGAQQYGQPEQKYDLSGNPIPSSGTPPPASSPYGTPPAGGGPAPGWPPPPPPGGAYGQAAPGAFGPSGAYGQPGYYPVQVKGSQILTMGILSFICFGIILGPVAFVQGTKALAAIDRGEADPTQRGAVSAGRICGLIGGILAVILIIARLGAIGAALSQGGH